MPFEIRPDMLLFVPVILFSLTIHEFAHALSARIGGDMTSTYMGRLTFNPLAHVDPIGTILMPLITLFTGVPLIYWAKPVPVDHMRLKSGIWSVIVSLAGPASNLAVVVVLSLILKIVFSIGGDTYVEQFLLARRLEQASIVSVLMLLAWQFLFLNLLLAIFNLIPIPPLDGSWVVYYFAIRNNPGLWRMWENLTRFGFIILLLLFYFPPFRMALSYAYNYPFESFYDGW